MRRTNCLVALAVAWLATACTYPVHEDYAKYLAINHGKVTYPKVADSAYYYLDPATEDHSYGIKSFRGGLYLNTWVVDFGRIMDSTMESVEIRSAFKSVEKVKTPDNAEGLLLVFELDNYTFGGYRAEVTMEISAKEGGRDLVSKTYSAVGRGQGGKMFWGGSFTMKNAVQQSTKNAIDQILAEFVKDLGEAAEVARSAPPDSTDGPPGDGAKVDKWL